MTHFQLILLILYGEDLRDAPKIDLFIFLQMNNINGVQDLKCEAIDLLVGSKKIKQDWYDLFSKG